MVTFEQQFQSMQVQFYSLHSTLEIQKTQNKPFTKEMSDALERIEKSAKSALDKAKGKTSAFQSNLLALQNRIKELKKLFTDPDNRQKVLDVAGSIKEALKSMNTAIFSANLSIEQSSSLHEDRDEHLATANWIVARASNSAKSSYPLTYKTMTSCTLEIQSGKYGKQLKIALVDSLPEVWSIESLTKLAIIVIAKKGQPLSSLDCFEISPENTSTYEKIQGTVAKIEEEVVEVFILNPASFAAELADCNLQLNRFIKKSKIVRSEALGLMNLLQQTLNKTNFLDQLEEMLQQNIIEEAFTFIRSLSEQTKKARALLFLTHHLHTRPQLERIQDSMCKMPSHEYYDDSCEEFVQVLLSKEMIFCDIAYKAAKAVKSSEAQKPLFREIANHALVVDSVCFITMYRDGNIIESGDLLVQFLKLHASHDLEMALRIAGPWLKTKTQKSALMK